MSNKLFKSTIIGFFSLAIFLTLPLNLKAQSDYEITEKFKESYKNFDFSVDTVNSINKLTEIETQIISFKENYLRHKNLLDKALYPDDFNISFKKLSKKIESTKIRLQNTNDLQVEISSAENKIVQLEEELITLTEDIKKLKEERTVLIKEIDQLRTRPLIDKKTIDSLHNYITQLRMNIRERDTLIMQIIDSVFITHINKTSDIKNSESGKISVRIKSTNLLENLKTLITDNIYYVNSAEVNSQDLSDLKMEQSSFSYKWKSLGNSLTNIYAGEKKKQDELGEVNGLLEDWNRTIDVRIWSSIYKLFKEANIVIDSFDTGENFYNTLMNYVNNQLDTLQDDPDFDGSDYYNNFAENVWNSHIEPVWTPLLLKYDMISNEQFENLQASIKSWSLEIESPLKIWLYIGIAAIFIFFTIIFINYTAKKSKDKDYD